MGGPNVDSRRYALGQPIAPRMSFSFKQPKIYLRVLSDKPITTLLNGPARIRRGLRSGDTIMFFSSETNLILAIGRSLN